MLHTESMHQDSLGVLSEEPSRSSAIVETDEVKGDHEGHIITKDLTESVADEEIAFDDGIVPITDLLLDPSIFPRGKEREIETLISELDQLKRIYDIEITKLENTSRERLRRTTLQRKSETTFPNPPVDTVEVTVDPKKVSLLARLKRWIFSTPIEVATIVENTSTIEDLGEGTWKLVSFKRLRGEKGGFLLELRPWISSGMDGIITFKFDASDRVLSRGFSNIRNIGFFKKIPSPSLHLLPGDEVDVLDEVSKVWSVGVVEKFSPDEFCTVRIGVGERGETLIIPAFAYTSRLMPKKFHQCIGGITRTTSEGIGYSLVFQDLSRAEHISVYNTELGVYVRAELIDLTVISARFAYDTSEKLKTPVETVNLLSDIEYSMLCIEDQLREIITEDCSIQMNSSRKIRIDVYGASSFNANEELVARHETYLARLESVQLKLVPSSPNGGQSLFKALSLQIFGSEANYELVRSRTYEHIRDNSLYYSCFVDNFDEYVHAKFNAVELNHWAYGDHLDIQAAAELWNFKVEIYSELTHDLLDPLVMYSSSTGTPTVRLSYAGLNHFDSIVHSEPQTFPSQIKLELDDKYSILNRRIKAFAQLTDHVDNNAESESLFSYFKIMEGEFSSENSEVYVKMITRMCVHLGMSSARIKVIDKALYSASSTDQNGQLMSILSEVSKPNGLLNSTDSFKWSMVMFGTEFQTRAAKDFVHLFVNKRKDKQHGWIRAISELKVVPIVGAAITINLGSSSRNQESVTPRPPRTGAVERVASDIAAILDATPMNFWSSDMDCGIERLVSKESMSTIRGLVNFGDYSISRTLIVFKQLLISFGYESIQDNFDIEFARSLSRGDRKGTEYQLCNAKIWYPVFWDVDDTTIGLDLVNNPLQLPIEICGSETAVNQISTYIRNYSFTYTQLGGNMRQFRFPISAGLVLQLHSADLMVSEIYSWANNFNVFQNENFAGFLCHRGKSPVPEGSCYRGEFFMSIKTNLGSPRDLFRLFLSTLCNTLDEQDALAVYQIRYDDYEALGRNVHLGEIHIDIFNRSAENDCVTLSVAVLVSWREFSDGKIVLAMKGINHPNSQLAPEELYNNFWDMPGVCGVLYDPTIGGLWVKIGIEANATCWLGHKFEESRDGFEQGIRSDAPWVLKFRLYENAFKLFQRTLDTNLRDTTDPATKG